MNGLLLSLRRETTAKIAVVIFGLFTLFWLSLFLFPQDSVFHALYGSTYGVMAAYGGVVGIMISRHWGGSKSLIGKAILFFALGLLAQFFGQVAYSLYIYVFNVDLPYPSLGDLGYFGSIPIYIYAVWALSKLSGVSVEKGSLVKKMIAISIPALMLVLSYVFLLQGYEYDWSQPLVVLLDFGYPFGQAVYVSMAMLTYVLSRKVLGGIMKDKILFIIFALFVQYLSDYSFLYLTKNNLWFVGGINDYIYLVAYFLMALGLIQLKTTFDSLNGGKDR